jgi:hypothetical protein
MLVDCPQRITPVQSQCFTDGLAPDTLVQELLMGIHLEFPSISLG